MERPTISVVTPSLNQGRFIEATIKSVLEQAYSNLEYVIVDGCSTDGTGEILDAYSSRARIIVEPDRGQTDALRKGFDHSAGEILGWINADDLLVPGALAKVADAFLAHPTADVVVGNLTFIDADGVQIGMFKRKRMAPEDWTRNCMSIPQPATFFRSTVFQGVGGLDPLMEYSMDYDLFFRMAIAGAHFVYLDDVLASFRVHPASKSVRVPWRQWREELQVYRRNGGTLISPFTYWKTRSIVSYFVRRLLSR